MKGDLYIATRSDRGDIVKIGRSYNVRKWCAALSTSQCFRVSAAHVYPGCGAHERGVHEALQHLRVTGGSGAEWFQLTAEQARDVVDRIVCPNRELNAYEQLMWELRIPESMW
jgi:hypothetical protein